MQYKKNSRKNFEDAAMTSTVLVLLLLLLSGHHGASHIERLTHVFIRPLACERRGTGVIWGAAL